MIDVVVAGAGPNGLMTACELALHGAGVLVLERRAEPAAEQRANGLAGQVVRMLDRRGLLERLTGSDKPPEPIPRFMFAALPLPLHRLGADNPMYTILAPQRRIEEMLAARAVELGVEIRRGVGVAGFEQGPDSVTVQTDHGHEVRARWLVGADGGHSVVRKAAGIGFPGVTRDDSVSRAAHVGVPRRLVHRSGGLDVPGFGVIPPFRHTRTERGLIAYAPFPDGRRLLSVSDRTPPGDEPFTIAELRAAAERVLGVPLDVGEPSGDGPHMLRRTVGGNTRLADAYRRGRVVLVGDAAHVHSAIGGPGLNLGLQDAVNLGWKLAAQVRGHAPEALVDTYESERRPMAERVVMHTMAQAVLVGPGPEVTALRTLVGELLTDEPALLRVANLIAGGPQVPDTVLADGTRLATLARAGGFLFVDRGGLGRRVPRDRVRVVEDAGPGESLLLRPDFEVAWSSARPVRELRAALTRWLGAA
ncbi:FAD-dependent oxidoreductase [Actinoplanes sp. NPDC049265]|uniref:FAD-dependent oxidoreductase n=1 Tax=Actinoplanes sp. NPDC049265 TaxID=3363902 RepID=UPI00371A7712